MQDQVTWIGMATLVLSESNPKKAEGFIGAFAGFVCAAADIAVAVDAINREFLENGYLVIGLDDMLPVHMLDRPLTEYETKLVEAIDNYPVQFNNVHLHKGDG